MKKSPVPLNERPRSGPYSGLNVSSARRFLAKQFEQAGLADCAAEAREFVMAATGLSHAALISNGTDFISPEAFDRLQDYSARRLSGEPLDNILGWRDFYGRRFQISPNVLSPRQETEEVTAKALEKIKPLTAPNILDLGTGSGAIIVTLLKERPTARGVAVDISNAALKIAAGNAASHGVSSRLKLIQGNWLSGLNGQFDLIISNPPYIDSEAMEKLPHDVLGYDPEISLHGGKDGLDPYRVIASQAMDYLSSKGWLVFEIGFDQGISVPNILKASGFIKVDCYKDAGGHPRIVTAQRAD